MVDNDSDQSARGPSVYRITDGKDEDSVVYAVFEEDGQFVFEHEGTKVLRRDLPELIRSVPVLHEINALGDVTVESPVLKDIEIVSLLSEPASDSGTLTINDWGWWWSTDEKSGRLYFAPDDIQEHAERHYWSNVHYVLARQEYAGNNIEGDLDVFRMGSYYEAQASFDEETLESISRYVEEPEHPWDLIFFEMGYTRTTNRWTSILRVLTMKGSRVLLGAVRLSATTSSGSTGNCGCGLPKVVSVARCSLLLKTARA